MAGISEIARDIRDWLHAFIDHEVRFLVVGATHWPFTATRVRPVISTSGSSAIDVEMLEADDDG